LINSDAPPNFLRDSTANPKGENNRRIRSCGMLPSLKHFGAIKKMTSKLITHTRLHKPNNKLVNA
jgi:hypothetical protein